MSMEKLEPISNNVLLVLQICLGIWQFMKLTPVGAMIQGLMGWLLRPFRLSPTYARLQHCEGRVFKRLNCYVLQPDIPSERTGIHRVGHNTNSLESTGIERDSIELNYLREEFSLQRRGTQRNMLFILQRKGTETNTDGKMYSYITPTIWEELQTLEEVLNHGRIAVADAAEAAAAAAADRAAADARAAAANAAASNGADVANAAADAAAVARAAADARAAAASYRVYDPTDAANARANARAAALNRAFFANATAASNRVFLANAAAAAAADRTAAAAAADSAAAAAAADRAAAAARVFVKGLRGFWEDVITGGVMSLNEVLDEIIVYNQHVSPLLSDDWLLPVNMSVSEEKLLKIINLFALFLQTKKEYVHWLLPTSMSFIAALLEFSTGVRVLLYTQINVVLCTSYVIDSVAHGGDKYTRWENIWTT